MTPIDREIKGCDIVLYSNDPRYYRLDLAGAKHPVDVQIDYIEVGVGRSRSDGTGLGVYVTGECGGCCIVQQAECPDWRDQLPEYLVHEVQEAIDCIGRVAAILDQYNVEI